MYQLRDDMDVHFSEEQLLLRESARDFLERECPMSIVRETVDAPGREVRGLWTQMAALGWLGLAVPEAHGGSGLGLLELALVMEPLGRALCPAPYWSAVVLAGGAVTQLGSDAQRKALLPGLADGTARGTLALFEDHAGWRPAEIELRARETSSATVLDGTKRFVPDADRADWIAVAARTEAGIGVFVVEVDRPGVEIRPIAWTDPTRGVCEVVLNDVELPPSARLGDGGDDSAGLEALLDRARVALAAEMLGGAERVLEISVAYAKTREQFGRPIGSFQSIQHRCADMLVAVENARSAVTYAAWSVENGEADAHSAACMAKAFCSDAYTRVSGDGIQIHGGLGFTWDQDLHLYFKRAKACEAFLGDAAAHREQIAEDLIDRDPAG